MTTYYMSENNGGFRKAEKLNAETLTAASSCRGISARTGE